MIKEAKKLEDEGFFDYKGRRYSVAHENYLTRLVEKTKVPEILTRVVPVKPLKFDRNDILMPSNPQATNSMVSTADQGEWEKFARMFHSDHVFRVIHINTAALVGPIFLAGNQILLKGEYLVLAPRSSIIKVETYLWKMAGPDYDYKESQYRRGESLSFYQRLVVNPTRGKKPSLFSANSLDEL